MYDLMDYITQVPSYVNARTKFTKFIIDRNCQSQEKKYRKVQYVAAVVKNIKSKKCTSKCSINIYKFNIIKIYHFCGFYICLLSCQGLTDKTFGRLSLISNNKNHTQTHMYD